jgi:hypothetical protein
VRTSIGSVSFSRCGSPITFPGGLLGGHDDEAAGLAQTLQAAEGTSADQVGNEDTSCLRASLVIQAGHARAPKLKYHL